MAILVDTNVLSDVLTGDPVWMPWSRSQLECHRGAGLVINPVIYAELSIPAHDLAEVDRVVTAFGLDVREIPRAGLFAAGKAFLRYRTGGGTKSSTLPYFFIGGHAEATGLAILTRDPGRFRTYFPGVPLVSPGG